MICYWYILSPVNNGILDAVAHAPMQTKVFKNKEGELKRFFPYNYTYNTIGNYLTIVWILLVSQSSFVSPKTAVQKQKFTCKILFYSSQLQ